MQNETNNVDLILGNILGYVRLVRSAGIKYIAKAAVFLPPSSRSVPFGMAEKCVELHLNEVTCDAAWNVKVNVANLSKDFVTKPDYFKVSGSGIFRFSIYEKKYFFFIEYTINQCDLLRRAFAQNHSNRPRDNIKISNPLFK